MDVPMGLLKEGPTVDYIACVKVLPNPYDYFDFASRCASSGAEVLSFSDFAQLVQTEVLDKNSVEIKPPVPMGVSAAIELSTTPPQFNMTHAEVTVTKPCCGGGKVL